MNTNFIAKIILTSLLLGVSLLLSAQIQIGTNINGEATADRSGSSVSISADGTRVAIGAYSNDGNGSNAGHVRIYEEAGGTWMQVGNDIDGEAADDYSGRSGSSVSISADGTRVAIGASSNDGNGSNAGHVRIYEEVGGTWTQVGNDIDGEAANDFSGRSVSISADGTRVAIGARGNDGNGSSAGHVRIYEEAGGTWTKIGNDIDGEAANDFSGHTVSISADGTRVAIGAISNDGNGSGAGHVRIYKEAGGTWTQVGNDIDGEAADDQLGTSVSISADGTRVAIGAKNNDGNGSNAGHVRIYEEAGGAWTQVGNDIDGEAAGDLLGTSVSISADGTRVAIGAEDNDGNGSDAGHVRIYEEAGGTWTQIGNDIDGEAAGDLLGTSVSISADGTRFGVGASSNDGNGSNAGHTRVFLLGSVISILATTNGNETDGGVVTYQFSNDGIISDEDVVINFSLTSSLPSSSYTVNTGGAGAVTYDTNTQTGTITMLANETTVNLPINVNGEIDNIVEEGETITIKVEDPN